MFKNTFCVSIILFCLLFVFESGKAFANAAGELKQAETSYQNIVTNYPNTDYALNAQTGVVKANLAVGDNADAEAAIEKLKNDFSGHLGLPKAIDDIAYKCRNINIKRYSKAIELYQYSLSRWPNGEYALKSQKLIAKASIEAGDLVAADRAFAKLLSDYSSHPDLAEAIYELARKYRSIEIKRYNKAIELYQHIIVQCPNSEDAFAAQTLIAKASFEAGNLVAADKAVAKLLSDYSSNPGLAKAVNELAREYRRSKRYSKAIELYQYSLSRWPVGEYAMESQKLIAKASIEAGDLVAADKAVTKLLSDYSSNPGLAKAVNELAREYRRSKRYSKAIECYQYIIVQWPKSEDAFNAQKLIVEASIEADIEADNLVVADGKAFAKLLSDYPSNPGLATAIFEIADIYSNKNIKRYDKAIELYKHIIAQWPNSADAFNAQKLIAKTNIEAGDLAAADKAVAKLLSDYSLNSGLAETIYELAREYRRSKRYSKAIELYQYIIGRWPNGKYDLESQKLIAKANIEADKLIVFDGAVATLLSDYSSNPDLTKALYDLAECCYAFGKYLKAGQVYQKVLDNKPNAKRAMRSQKMLAQVNVKLGNYEVADAAVSKFCSDYTSHKDLPDSLCDIADCYLKSKKYEKAKESYQHILDRWPNVKQALRLRTNIIESNIMLGNEAVADAAFSKLLTDFPEDEGIFQAVWSIAESYRKSERYEKAIQLYQYSLDHWPDNELAIFSQKGLVIANIYLGNDAKVKAETKKLFINFKGSTDLATAVYQIGEEYYVKALKCKSHKPDTKAKNNFLKTLDIWKRITKEMPASANRLAKTYFGSAVCYEKLGNYEKAIEHYEKVVETCPDYKLAWKAQFMAGRYYEKLGQTGAMSKLKAKSKTTIAYRQLLAKYPDCKAAKAARIWLSKVN